MNSPFLNAHPATREREDQPVCWLCAVDSLHRLSMIWRTVTHNSSAVTRYDPTTIWLHWITVGLIVALWVIGQTGDWFPRGPLRTGIWSIHVTLGFATVVVLLTRVAWRAHFGRILPPADSGILYIIAKVTHYALYLLFGPVVLA
jgi:cytochrome b561